MRYLVILILLVSGLAGAGTLPANSRIYLPVLQKEIAGYWPTMPQHSVLAAQVETESCITVTHKKCWSPFAELKTDRENGIGLGQLTVTKSFDNFTAARKLDSSLKNWAWENRYNAEYQLRTLVIMNKLNFGKFSWATDTHQQLAFMFAAYNGGVGGVLSDRAVCRATPGCMQDIWFGHVEHTSKKAKLALKGYGQSFFQINRRYVSGMWIRNLKYVEIMGN